MDGERFDRLVESLTRPGSRRDAVRALASAILGTAGLSALAGGDTAAKSKGKRKGKGTGTGRNRRARAQARAASCCSTGDCAPGANKNLAKCCYENPALIGANFRRSNLGEANFRGANLANADFSNANLGKACLVDADLTGAMLTGANLTGAVFCRTKTGPNSYNNSGCGQATACCPTCVPLGDSRCALGGSCCGGGFCVDNTCVCPVGRQNCGGACRDLQNDARNCGTCGNSCPAGETCRAGQCQCGAGLTRCNGRCVDLRTDIDNCTECGNACPETLLNARVFCGEAPDENDQPGFGCAYQCNNENVANCSGDPLRGCETIVANDPNNCGACGFKCPADRPRCCGCRCFTQDSTTCSVCQILTSPRLIRRR